MCSTQCDDSTFCVEQFIKQEIKLEPEEDDFIKAVSQIKYEPDDNKQCLNDSTHSFECTNIKVEHAFEMDTDSKEIYAVTGAEANGDIIVIPKASRNECDMDGVHLDTVMSSAEDINIRNSKGTAKGKATNVCIICSYSALSKSQLIRHTRRHTGEKLFKCDLCSYAAANKSDMVKHTRRHTGEKPYKCELCSYATSQKSNLVRHTRIHTGEKPFKCDMCSYAAIQSSALVMHTRIHTGEKPFKCDLCSYATVQKCALVIHTRKHTGEKPYKCDQCSYAAAQSSSLVKHTRKHTRHESSKCSACVVASTKKSSLLQHIVECKHAAETPNISSDSFSSASVSAPDLNTHAQIHVVKQELPHNSYNPPSSVSFNTCHESFTCDGCSFTTSWKSDLIAHRRTHLRTT